MPTPTLSLDAAHRFYGMGAFAQALDSLQRVEPGRERLLLTGACLARLRRADEAVAVFTELLTLDPECHEALTWMALLKRDPRNMEASLDYARRAVTLRPEDATGHGALGSGYLAAKRPEAAIEAFLRAIELAPEVAEHHHNLALAYLMVHRHGDATAQLREAVALDPRSPQNYLALASTYAQFGMAGRAIECLTDGLSHLPDCAPLHTSIAAAFASIRNDAAAERHHRRALELSPESRGAYGTWLLNQGRFDEANAIFEAMLHERIDPAHAYYGLMQGRKTADDTFVEAMETLQRSGRLRPRSGMFLRYALGRAEEGRKRYGEAMAHFDAANRLAQATFHAGAPVSPTRFSEERETALRFYERVRESSPAGDPTAAPIFIIGMIRSGTTLLDQIVSSHPSVASVGELRFWMEETQRLIRQGGVPRDEELRALAEDYVGYARLLAGPSKLFTDKMPLNFTVAGLIHLAMPNARFLHIRRHPVDIALSIWTTYFGQGPLFAYDKASIVGYYREYELSMADWREALPKDRLLELDYEDLIADPEPTIRQVIGFLGLPWDDACLHHDQNASAINTPSRWQARQPIYRTSVERWRRYEPWLGEFAELRTEA